MHRQTDTRPPLTLWCGYKTITLPFSSPLPRPKQPSYAWSKLVSSWWWSCRSDIFNLPRGFQITWCSTLRHSILAIHNYLTLSLSWVAIWAFTGDIIFEIREGAQSTYVLHIFNRDYVLSERSLDTSPLRLVLHSQHTAGVGCHSPLSLRARRENVRFVRVSGRG